MSVPGHNNCYGSSANGYWDVAHSGWSSVKETGEMGHWLRAFPISIYGYIHACTSVLCLLCYNYDQGTNYCEGV